MTAPDGVALPVMLGEAAGVRVCVGLGVTPCDFEGDCEGVHEALRLGVGEGVCVCVDSEDSVALGVGVPT